VANIALLVVAFSDCACTVSEKNILCGRNYFPGISKTGMVKVNYARKATYYYLLSSVAWFSLLAVSCSKEEGEAGLPDPVAPEVKIVEYVPVHPGIEGTLVSLKITEFEDLNSFVPLFEIGNAFAIFPDSTGLMRTAGDVLAENIPLQNQDNFYAYRAPDSSEGINFSLGPVRWTISGSSNINPVNFIVPDGFPVVTDFNNPSLIVDRNLNYTFGTVDPFFNADSVRYMIYSAGAYIYANRTAMYYSHTFDTDLLGHLKAGKGYIRIIAFRSLPVEINGKFFQILNQNSIIREVEIL
jgi:hypothetical protein